MGGCAAKEGRHLDKVASSAQKGGSKLEKRLVYALAESHGSKQCRIKSFNSILLKFPKIDRAFQNVRTTFHKYDTDGSGSIDVNELKACFVDLKVDVSPSELLEYYQECDMDASSGISFKEFIITLALVHLLAEPKDGQATSRIKMPELEATLDSIVDAFMFFDKDHDGYVSKEELKAVFSESYKDGQGSNVAMQRFEEMDWDKNGSVTFKEFLFAFADWVGVEDDEDTES